MFQNLLLLVLNYLINENISGLSHVLADSLKDIMPLTPRFEVLEEHFLKLSGERSVLF